MGRSEKIKFVNLQIFPTAFIYKEECRKKNSRASYAVSKLKVDKMRPFVEGDFVIKCLITVLNVVCLKKSCYFHFHPGRELQDKSRICQQM